MIPDETTPIDESLLGSLLAADAAISCEGGPGRPADDSWVDDCLRLLEMIRPPAGSPEMATGERPRLSFGRFELVRELGRGGMGVVYLARDPVLGRDVALKVPRPEVVVTAEARRRFMRKAHIAAVLDHPNIVPLYEAGELGSVAYLVSAYCDGRSLSAWLKVHREPVPERVAARLIATLGGAVEHAHERGILHRDLKPGNIMLQAPDTAAPASTDLSTLIPRITDFGLAKLTEDDGDLTRSGMAMGSPPYMSPEQAAGRLRDLGPTTDVYTLGATLYELLTGRVPFRGETSTETIRQVIQDDPIAPRVLRPKISRDLETICLHCLNKDAARRYQSAAALAQDLERFLAGRPILARPASPRERALKWARRRPDRAALAALAAIVAVGAAGGMAWSNSWLREHNRLLRREIDRADRHADEAERHLHAAQLRLARQAFDAGQFERVQEVLLDDVYGPGPGHRDFAWWYLWRLSRREVALLGHHEAPVRCIDLSPDGRALASGDAAGNIILWDTSSGRSRTLPPGQRGAAERLAFSPDGSVLASCGEIGPASTGEKELRLWDVASGRLRARPVGAVADEVRVMTFLDGGRLLAVVTRDAHDVRTIRVWDLAADAAAPSLRYRVAGFGFVMTSPGGGVFAVRESDGRLTLRDVADGRITRTVSTELPDASALAVSADGRWLAAASAPNRVFVWDLGGDREPRVYSDHLFRPDRLIFAPDASTLLAVAGGRQVSVRDLATGRKRMIASFDPARVGEFRHAFSPDGSRLALYGHGQPGGTMPVAIWRVATGVREECFPGRRTFQYLAFAPDGQGLFLGGDHDVSIWRPSPPESPETFANHRDEVWAVAFAPDGRTVASGGDDQALRIWDPTTGRERLILRGHTATVSALAFRPDGRTIASGSLDDRDNVKLWDVATGRLIRTLAGHTRRARAVAFGPDGRILASGGSDWTVRLWDGDTGTPRAVLVGHEDVVRQVTFSPDGRTLASAGNDRTVRLWDPRLGRSLAVLRSRYPVSSAAFSPDGRTLASADENGYITLWDMATRSPRRVINLDDDELRALVFSPDGRTLASAGVSRSIRLWDTVTGQELPTLGGNLGQVNALAFSPDGGMLISADHGGVVRLYRGPPDLHLPPMPLAIHSFASGTTVN